MNGRQAMMLERNAQRDEMTRRLASACNALSIKVCHDVVLNNVFWVEDANGTQYTVTVSRSRRQSD